MKLHRGHWVCLSCVTSHLITTKWTLPPLTTLIGVGTTAGKRMVYPLFSRLVGFMNAKLVVSLRHHHPGYSYVSLCIVSWWLSCGWTYNERL